MIMFLIILIFNLINFHHNFCCNTFKKNLPTSCQSPFSSIDFVYKRVRLFTIVFQNPTPIIHCVHNSDKAYFVKFDIHVHPLNNKFVSNKRRVEVIRPLVHSLSGK